jgi:hypothetical protein
MAVVGDADITVVSKVTTNGVPKVTKKRKGSVQRSGDEGSSYNVKEVVKELESLRKEVTKLRSENADLLGLRKKVDGEIDELTAALFEEAYKMVNGAHEKRAKVEKRLEESQHVVAGLEAESKALKTLLESGGTLPLQPPKTGRKLSISSWGGKTNTSPSNGVAHSKEECSVDGAVEKTSWQHGEVDTHDMELLCAWLPTKTLSRENSYINLLYTTDIKLCLSFSNEELSQRILSAIEEFTLFMESVPSQMENTSSQCSLTYTPGKCGYRLKLTEDGSWYYVNVSCRDRIASACDLYMFLRHIQQGLVKSGDEYIYWEIAKLRAKMNMARLHLKAL